MKYPRIYAIVDNRGMHVTSGDSHTDTFIFLDVAEKKAKGWDAVLEHRAPHVVVCYDAVEVTPEERTREYETRLKNKT